MDDDLYKLTKQIANEDKFFHLIKNLGEIKDELKIINNRIANLDNGDK